METVFQNVLTASFHGSIVIAAVLLLRLALRKTPKKFLCLLWLLAGLRLLMPFEIKSELSLQPELPEVSQVQMAPMAPMPDVLPAPAPEDPPVFPIQEPVRTAPVVEDTVTPGVVEAVTVEKGVDWEEMIPWIWLAVACCFAVYIVFSYATLRVQVREAVKIPGGWECDRIETAFILGFIRPKIYIPMGLPRSVRKHILAHERTHLEKGDHWFKMIGFLALAIHWFNPLVWVAYILLCKDIEMACDERVVQFMELEERKSYSAALLCCSTTKAHLAACPVAFGEVSVKARIKSVLHYKKPSFWISLLGVLAVAFVAVCLLTSPMEEPADASPAADAAVETVAAEEPKPAAELFAEDMSQEEILNTIREGLNELRTRESYLFFGEAWREGFEGEVAKSEIRRHGTNTLSLADNLGSAMGSTVYLEGTYAMHYGDAWVLEDKGEDYVHNPTTWLNNFDPDQLGDVKYVDVQSGDTLTFQASWEQWGVLQEGTFFFTFREDGTLTGLRREVPEDQGDGTVLDQINHYYVPWEEDPQVTYAKIQEEAAKALSPAELKIQRARATQVTEVPSNKLDYDKNFLLGSGQMGWQMADGEWFFKFGAENVSATGATLAIELSSPYGGKTIARGTVESGNQYFLERLEDGLWVTVPPETDNFQNIAPRKLAAGDRQTINWEANYGKLKGGFYRIGNYYTFTSDSGITDTQVCYAKFRLYDPHHQTLLAKAKAAIEGLKNRDSYHMYTVNWDLEFEGERPRINETWKWGKDYLSCDRLVNQPETADGSLWREGKHYGLAWESDPVTSPVRDWNQSVDSYMDDSNFTMWAWDFEWYDANVELVYEEGKTLRILQTFPRIEEYAYTEIVLTLDDDGNLIGLTKYYVPERNSVTADKVISHELVVFEASAEDVKNVIYAQDVTSPMAFSYEEDVGQTTDAQTTGFVNTVASPIATCTQAVALADRECTLEPLAGFDNGYLQTKVYHDGDAGMWKVHLFWWQHDAAQTVYLNDQGITQRIVTVK